MKKIYFALSLLILSMQLATAQKLDRIEPAFWWAGMSEPNLQLLVHGQDIGTTTIKLDKYPGVTLVSADKVESKNYIFLNLKIDKSAQPGTFGIAFQNNKGKSVATYNYTLKQRRQGSASRESFTSQDVMYLIMPDRFANGDTTNDSLNDMPDKVNRANPNGRHGGDLQGIEQQLDYIESLGITTIWVNPVLENNMQSSSYHGYATTDFYKVDARLGGNTAYTSLINKSHDKNIKVVMDMIFNHCGSEHWWMNDLPMKNWLNQWPNYTQTNYRGTAIADPYISELDKNYMTNGWFVETMPDLNQKNPYVAKYLIQNSIWWIEEGNIDGIRMDTHPYADKHMMATWAQAVVAEYPNFMIVGEVWLNDPAALAYWGKDARNFDGFNSHLPGLIDFPFMFATKKAILEDNGWWEGASGLYYILSKDYLYKDPNTNLTFLDNHDLSRIWSELGKDMDKLKLAYTFLLTTRGIPMIYYASEILSDGFEHDGHGFIRKDFPGGWPTDTRNAFTQAGRTTDENQIFDHLKTLLNWRKTKSVIHTGKLTHWVPRNNVYSYIRHNDDEAVLVLLNKDTNTQKFDPQLCAELLNKYTKGRDVITGKTYLLSDISIPSMASIVLELE